MKAKLFANATGLLDVHSPAFPAKKDMNAPVAKPNTRLTDVSDPLFQGGLIGTCCEALDRIGELPKISIDIYIQRG